MMNRQGVSNINVKLMNLDSVYWFIYTGSHVSTKDIMIGLNLSLPTVTQNLKELTARGLVVSEGVLDSTGGRKARAYAINTRGHFTLGLDITMRRVGLVLLDLPGNIVLNESLPLKFRDREDYYASVGRISREALKRMGIEARDVLGVGISLPAILSHDGLRAVNASPLGVMSLSRAAFEAHLPFACTLYNDANAGGYAEFWARDPSSERGDRSLAYLSVSDTVGGSIMVDGKMYLGMQQHSAEFGHIALIPDGKPCYCGQRGCAYAYINTRILADMAGGELGAFFKALESGEREYQARWDEYLYFLALTIGNIRAMLDCDLIIGGYLGNYMEPYIGELRRRVAMRNCFEQTGDFVLNCRNVCEVAAVGAALMHQYERVKQMLNC